MLRPSPAGVASGSLGTVLIKLLVDCFRNPPVVAIPSSSLGGEPECEVLDLGGGRGGGSEDLPDWLSDLHYRSFLIGLVVGIIFGPVIDFLYLARAWWGQTIRRLQSRLQRVGYSLYRLLE